MARGPFTRWRQRERRGHRARLAALGAGHRGRHRAAAGMARRARRPPLFLNGIAGLGGPFWKPDFASRFVDDGEPWQKAVAVVESMAFLPAGQHRRDRQVRAPGPAHSRERGVSRFDGLCRRLASVSACPCPARRRGGHGRGGSGISPRHAGESGTRRAEESVRARGGRGPEQRYERWRGSSGSHRDLTRPPRYCATEKPASALSERR